MNNGITLDKWMEFVWLAPVTGAEKYHLCQRLNKDEANEIKNLVAQSADFDLNSMDARQGKLEHGHPYRDFLSGYLTLMLESGFDDVNDWRQMLWRALGSIDKARMRIYARRVFNMDIQILGCDR